MTTSKSQDPSLTLDERLKILYPKVNEDETPLPRCWSSKDKFNYIGLSNLNLTVQYKGHGKTHKDASSVRASCPIPTACGIYYFEVKIVSKGRDGYMGVGLSAQGVNMNRLPGWDKHSYGYHGGGGHSFCSSGTGQAYGPTFTTNDVIGCGVNLVDNTCFYTKNGHNLGEAFRDLPPGLYPTVGLQTPGEIVDANFGQTPFVFDIEGEMIAAKAKILGKVDMFPTPGRHGDWQNVLHTMVSSYLVHHGYCATAESFNRSTGLKIEEDMSSIKSRQSIRRLVLSGRIGEAIKQTQRLYPELLEPDENAHLLFMLKVRQFIEMVSGADPVEAASVEAWAPRSKRSKLGHDNALGGSSEEPEDTEMAANTNGNSSTPTETDATNGNAVPSTSGEGVADGEEGQDAMEVDPPSNVTPRARFTSVTANPNRFDKLIRFGQGLQSMISEMRVAKVLEGTALETATKMLQDAFSLLAYTDPWSSPVGWQLEQGERERISAALNSAILNAKGLEPLPPLELGLTHTRSLLKTMSDNNLGSCAFASVDDFVQ